VLQWKLQFGDIAIMPKNLELPAIFFELKSVNPWNIMMPTPGTFYHFENAIRDAEAKLDAIFGEPDQPISDTAKRKILELKVWAFAGNQKKVVLVDQIRADALAQLKEQLAAINTPVPPQGQPDALEDWWCPSGYVGWVLIRLAFRTILAFPHDFEKTNNWFVLRGPSPRQ